MFLKFSAAASAYTFAVVQAQGQILDTDSEDFKKTLNNSYAFENSSPGQKEDNTIGTCVYGEKEDPIWTGFDGEFEGLAPRDDFHELYQYGHATFNIKCGYEQMFDDIPQRQASIDKIFSEHITPELINFIDPESHSINRETLANFLDFHEDSNLNMHEKGPDYLVIDNFLEYFGLDKEGLLGARNEGQTLSDAVLARSQYARQDMITWLKGMDDSGEDIPELRKIA